MIVRANNVRNGLAAARRRLGLPRAESRLMLRRRIVDGGPYHLMYLCILEGGHEVFVKTKPSWTRGKSVEVLSD